MQRRAGFERDAICKRHRRLKELCRDGRLVRLKKNHYGLPDRQNLTARQSPRPPRRLWLFNPGRQKQRRCLFEPPRDAPGHAWRQSHGADRSQTARRHRSAYRADHRTRSKAAARHLRRNRRQKLSGADGRAHRRHSAQLERHKPEQGKVIAAEISRYGTALSPPEADLVKVMGDPDDPEVQAQSIIFRFDLSPSFPAGSAPRSQRAARLPSAPTEIARRRTDLRDLPIVTIDGENARDFDDAVFVGASATAATNFTSPSPMLPIMSARTPRWTKKPMPAPPASTFLTGRSRCCPKRCPTASVA